MPKNIFTPVPRKITCATITVANELHMVAMCLRWFSLPFFREDKNERQSFFIGVSKMNRGHQPCGERVPRGLKITAAAARAVATSLA